MRIIDDENQIRRLLRISLEANDFKVLDAQSGHEGLIAIAMNHPDVILLDLGLPDEDGLVILKNIREWSTIPVIVLTTCDADTEIDRAYHHHANCYICKPLSFEGIHRVLDGIVRFWLELVHLPPRLK